MSYFMYKQKKFIDAGDKFPPLVLVADSGITDIFGRSHPTHWKIYNITKEEGLLLDKENWKKESESIIKRELEMLKKFHDKYESYMPEPSMESKTCSGNSYPGGKKLKHFKSFLSIRRLTSVEDFAAWNERGFLITASYYDKSAMRSGEKETYFIDDLPSLIEADRKYRKFASKRPENRIMFVDVCNVKNDSYTF